MSNSKHSSATRRARSLSVLLACLLASLLVGATACEPEKVETKGSTEEAAQQSEEAAEDETEASDEEAAPEGEKSAETDEQPTTEEKAEAGDADPDRLAPGEERHFGGEFTLEESPISLTDAMKDLASLEGKPIKLEARVVTACRKKGCWMTIQPKDMSEDAAAEKKEGDAEDDIRVTFKDYGFFVPRHADGALAVMEGQFEREVVSEAHRKHLARDAKKSEEEIAAIEGDLETVQFVATAVDLKGAPEAEN